jgi:hypothetical protein
MPFNDSVIFRRNGIDSVVINQTTTLMKKNKHTVGQRYLFRLLLIYNCHSNRDTVETIDTMDMKEFVEDVVLKY